MFTTTCHCGTVTLEVARRPRKLTACNCSLCRRYGAIWAYLQRKSVRIVKGDRSLEMYHWRNGTLEFYRCAHCGCVMFHQRARRRSDGTDTRAVNVRNVDEVSVIADVPIRLLDGAVTWQVLSESAQPDLFGSPGADLSRG